MHRLIFAGALALTVVGWCSLSGADDNDLEKGLTQKIESGSVTGRELAEAYMQRGALKLMQKDVPGALADYDHAVATAPKLADAYLWRSFARSDAGDFQHAGDDISQALSLGVADEAGADYLRAEVWRKMKDYPHAIADYDHAIALDRNFGYAYIGRGEAKADADDLAGALVDLNQAVQDGPAIYINKKWPYRIAPYFEFFFAKMNWTLGTPDKAPVTAYLARGRLLLKMGNYERAQPDLEYAVQTDFKNPDPWIYRGLENLALHRCWNGRHDLIKAAELMSKPEAALVSEHQAFIDNTPCKDDALE